MLTAGAIAPAVEHIASLKRGSHQRAGPEKNSLSARKTREFRTEIPEAV